MANICSYEVVVKGKRNACFAFLGSMPAGDFGSSYKIIKDDGTCCEMEISGGCAWDVDYYCNFVPGDDITITIPEDDQEACNYGSGFENCTVQDCSKLFQVEVCLTTFVEGFCDEEQDAGTFYHYINGEKV